jgi:hypothetical protein
MLKKTNIIKKQLKNFYEQHFEKIIEINEKYATPSLAMSPTVRFALLALRFYLVFIVVLLVYKFITLIY